MGMLEELAKKLHDLGVGSITATPPTIRTRSLPASPDACIAIKGTAGAAPDLSLGSTLISVEYPGVQILVRGVPDDPDTPATTAKTIQVALAAVQATTLTASGAGATHAFYHFLKPSEPYCYEERDENGRQTWALNCGIEKEPSTT